MTLPTPMKVVLAVFIIILIGLGFWLVDWQKKMAMISSLENTLNIKKDDLAKNEALVKELPEQTKRKEDLQKQLRSIITEQMAPEEAIDFVPSYISEVERLVETERERCKDPDFIILTITPGVLTGGAAPRAVEKKEEGPAEVALAGYPTRMFQMTMTGRYVTLIDFLKQLGALKLKRLVTINRITLSPGGTAKRGESPVLNITIPITAYLRQGGGT